MSESLLERTADGIEQHEDDEIDELRMRIASQATDQQKEIEFQEYLVKKGILTEVCVPGTSSSQFRSFKPIVVKGRSVSESLIEDRR